MKQQRTLSLLLALALALGSTGLMAADQLTLSNGDRLSGTIVRSDTEKLVLETEYMGEVEVDWAVIEGIDSEQPLYVTDENGQVLVGSVSTSRGRLQVETAASGAVALPMSAVTLIRSEPAQAAHRAELERLRNPRLLDFWGGFFDLGLSFSRGNADTTNFTTSARVRRTTQRDKITLYMTSIYAQNSTTGDSVVTANAIRGGSRYDLQLRERMFMFGFADFEFDEFQNLDFRNVLGGGLGWNAVKSDRTTLDVFGGASLNQEFFENDVTRRSAEAVIGEEFVHNFSENTSFSERLTFFPNLSESGEYRLQFDAALNTRLNDWLAWQVSFSDRYLSNPPVGIQENDVLLSTGLRFTFGRK